MVNRSLRSNLISLSDLFSIKITTPGVAEKNKALILDINKDISGIRNLSVQNLNVGGSLLTASAAEINTVDTTPGLAEPGKALVFDINTNIIGINSLTSTYLNGSLLTASQPNITTVGILNTLTVNGNLNILNHNGSTTGLKLNGSLITANASEINTLDGITANVNELNTLYGITANVNQLNYVNTTIGFADANKALILDSNRDIINIRNIGATNISGTIQTASQPNITSVGTLTNLISNGNVNIASHNGLNIGLTLNDILVTATANEINYLENIIPGTVNATKVILVDENKDIQGFNNILLNGNLSTYQLTLNNILVQSTAEEINYLYNITKGIASNNKALVLDINKDISGIHNLGVDNLIISGTNFQLPTGNTFNRPVIPSLGYIRYNTETSQFEGYGAGNNWGSLGGVMNVQQTTKILAEISPGSNDNNLRFINSNIENMRITSTGLVGIGTNNPNYKLDISGSLNATGMITFTNITDASSNTSGGSLTISGGASIAKKLYVGTDLIVTGNITGTLQTASQPNITTIGTLTSLSTNSLTLNGTLVTSTAAKINYTDITTIGTADASKALIVDINKDISGIRNLSSTNLTGTLQTASQPNITTLTGVTSIGASNNTTLTGTLQTASQPNITTLAGITSIGASSSTTLTGTLQTSSQPNITSVGTLTSLSTNSLTLNGTLVTSTATKINYTDITTIGTAQASKALVLDANKDITGIRYLYATKILAGTSTDTLSNRLISALDSSQTSATSRFITVGQSSTSGNQAEILFYYVGDNNSNNRLGLGVWGEKMSILNNGRVGINNTAPDYLLHIKGEFNNYLNVIEDTTYGVKVGIGTGTNVGNIGTLTATSLNIVTGGVERMFLDNSNGRVGIGNTSPNALLDVSGNINSNASLTVANSITVSNYTTNSAQFIGNWSAANRWGIGTSNINSSAEIRIGICDAAGTWTGWPTALYTGAIYANNTMLLSVGAYAYFNSSNLTGFIGATSNNYAGFFNGRIACNGEINVISDYREKNSIELLTDQYCKDFIDKAVPVKFNYNNDTSQKHFGYIAQEVFKAGFEDLVTLCPREGIEEIIEEDGFVNPANVAFVMSTNEIIPILAKNIKIIYDEKNILENKVNKLETENQLLKDQIINIISRLQNLENQ